MTFRVLIVGVGSIGERHLRCFQKTGRVQVGLCELNESLRQTVAQRYQVTEAFGSLSDALAKKWDAAVICTPAHLHIAQARELVNAGLHVLIEKPLAISLDRVAELQNEAQAADRRVALAYVQRHNPVFHRLRQLVQSGEFGEPVQFTCVSGQNFPSFRPAYRNIYYARHETGGGAIQDALTHVINAGEWILGPVKKLVADAAHQVLEGVEVEDTVHLIVRHGDRIMGSYSLNQHQAPNEHTFTIACTRGTLRAMTHERKVASMKEPNTEWHEEILPPMERDDQFIAQAAAFLDVLEGKAEPASTLDDGIQTLKVNLAALASVREGVWKTI